MYLHIATMLDETKPALHVCAYAFEQPYQLARCFKAHIKAIDYVYM